MPAIGIYENKARNIKPGKIIRCNGNSLLYFAPMRLPPVFGIKRAEEGRIVPSSARAVTS
jgi:hypothetical protein